MLGTAREWMWALAANQECLPAPLVKPQFEQAAQQGHVQHDQVSMSIQVNLGSGSVRSGREVQGSTCRQQRIVSVTPDA